MVSKDVTKMIERMDRFEKRIGLRLEAISAFAQSDDEGQIAVTVRGEAHSTSGDELPQDVKIVISLFDKAGRVVGTDTYPLYADSFFGFETIDQYVELSGTSLAKIRIVPQFDN